RSESDDVSSRRPLAAAAAGLSPQCGLVPEPLGQFHRAVREVAVGRREFNRSPGIAVAVCVEQARKQGPALRDGGMQIRLRYVFWTHRTEDLRHGPVALARRGGGYEASLAALRKPAIR